MRLDPAFIEEVRKLMNRADKYGLEMKDVLQQHLSNTAETEIVEDDSPFTDIEIELDGYYEELFQKLLHIGDIPKVDVPTSLNATLRPYQQHGIEWLLYLRKLGFGALLADDMGLGKSIQTISYLLYIKENNLKTGPALIVAPTSVLGNWQKNLSVSHRIYVFNYITEVIEIRAILLKISSISRCCINILCIGSTR